MNARSKNFSYYSSRAVNAISSFYVFYGMELDLKEAVYGQYRQFPFYIDFSPVIATEIMMRNQDVIQYCMDVITSENNTAVITRDVIKAIEQADNAELHKLLLDLFIAAKIQEGLRQSIIETIDEYQIALFLSILDVIQEHKLIRYSSVQRGIMTWIGIGYETVEEKQAKRIFECIYDYLHNKEHHMKGFESENPLHAYLALYCVGLYDVDEAIEKAVQMLDHTKRHIVAAALIYLKLTNRFSVIKYMDLVKEHKEDEWILALYFGQCTGRDYESMQLKQNEVEALYDEIQKYVQGMKAQEKYSSKGFEWYSITLNRDALILSLFKLIKCSANQEMVEKFLPYKRQREH